MDNVTETDAWGDETHAMVFDYLHKMPNFIVKRHYETFNEGRLLKDYAGMLEAGDFFEIGCATGELYRYIKNFMPDFKYQGFDISEPAINRARTKYRDGNFHLLTNGFDEIRENFGRPNVVWCRDVVMHQERPYKFLENVINLSRDVSILRLRTRDEGETVIDSNISCQLHWDKFWVPYIVLNINELIDKISENKEVSKIVISRSYEVLGGQNYRYLPKELYFKESGTSETAIMVIKGERNKTGKVDITFMDKQDRPKLSIFERIIRKLSLLFR